VEVVRAVLAHWQPVIVVVDGSTDGSDAAVRALSESEPALTLITLATNSGKGAAVLAGAQVARDRGFTHALVMDADGQHPEESIGEFMSVSTEHPEAMILGHPIFPSNIPRERLHARKLSVLLVRVEMLGRGVDDPLFGFRVLPLEPLLAVLGPRRGGRRYDFDTEAAVRLAWAGVPPINVPAPVRYFSKAEGGISHFHYVRDNLTLAGMHIRLLAELFCRHWPALHGHRRKWRAAGLLGPVVAGALWLAVAIAPGRAMEVTDTAFDPAAWSDLAAAFARNPGVTAEFTERRHFPFRRTPVVLQGEVRVAADRGLSLRYLSPDRRTVIVDDEGLLVRDDDGRETPGADPRAAVANAALLHVLRFDFSSLEENFEVEGRREAGTWTLTLVPRDPTLRRGLQSINVDGEGAAVRRIVLTRSPRQRVEIAIAPPRSEDGFTDEDAARYFR
jgi:outer membrane lipoprotein-sorting protein